MIPQSKTIIPTEVLVSEFLKNKDISQFNAKAKIKVEDNWMKEKATVFIRAKKDSVIWMVIKRLGIEGARVLITPDSIYAINRLQKEYQIIPLTQLKKDFGVMPEFSYLYSLLLGIPPEIDSSSHWELDLNTNHLTITTMVQDILHKFQIDRKEGHIISGSFIDNMNISGNWEYENYQLLSDSISLPFYRRFNANLQDGNFLNVTLELSEIELNIDKSIKFKIPGHYKYVP